MKRGAGLEGSAEPGLAVVVEASLTGALVDEAGEEARGFMLNGPGRAFLGVLE